MTWSATFKTDVSSDEWVITTSIPTSQIVWDKDYRTNNYILRGDYIQPSSRHFNCKHCGAVNQVDICEYCGSAYEEGESE